ncbi:MAG: outer membrane protein assembly factor BamD [Bacteroidetes bacterium]|nr:outer membrane protein assembly factor BamD [Bacteroidota bacterium]MBS1932778.1 outer membrane protein assembly factor BamD [Bacteroidota bacterium]
MRLLFAVLISGFLLSSCSFLNKAKTGFGLFQGTGGGFAKVLKSKDYDYQLKMADKYYEKKDYNHAQQLYEQLFPVLKGSPQFEDLYYKFAFCSFYLKDYPNAENLFKGFVEVFPNSPKAEEMDYMRAFTFFKQSPKAELDQTNTTKTIGFMQAFINTHPGSPKIKDATEIIDKCRAKLELKDFKSAELYYNLGYFKASSITFNTLINTYPDSEKSDEYKLFVIKSDYQYANLSIEERKEERFLQVVSDCNDFTDRFPDSKLIKEVQSYLTLSQNNLKAIKNESAKKAG